MQHQLAQTQAAKLCPHVHAFDFTIGRSKESYAATTGGHAVVTHHKEGDRLLQQLLDGIAMLTLLRIEGPQVLIKLPDQKSRIRRIRTFWDNDGRHASLSRAVILESNTLAAKTCFLDVEFAAELEEHFVVNC